MTGALAANLEWPACACGRGSVRPGALVDWHGGQWHVLCALVEIASVAA